MGDKRKRFVIEEINYLNRLVLDKKSIVENKQSDAVTVQAKKRAWEEIANIYNAEPAHTKRTVAQLIKCWDNTKTKKKKELTDQKRARMMTGGGRAPRTPPLTEEGVAVEQLVTNVTDIELPLTIDSDTSHIASAGNCLNYQLGPDGILFEIEAGGSSADVTDQQYVDHDQSNTDPTTQPTLNFAPAPPEKPKRNSKAPRTQVVAAEMEERSLINGTRRQHELELHNLRVEELQTRLEIAKEDLKRSRLETEHKLKMWEIEEKSKESGIFL